MSERTHAVVDGVVVGLLIPVIFLVRMIVRDTTAMHQTFAKVDFSIIQSVMSRYGRLMLIVGLSAAILTFILEVLH